MLKPTKANLSQIMRYLRSIKSEARAEASRKNGALGGRPKKKGKK